MKKVSISGSLRANVGKKDAKFNRNQGLVPAVLYGGKEQLSVTVNEKAMVKLISSPEVYTIGLDINSKEYNCVIKEIQFHKVTDRVIHVDFLEIFDNKPVILDIPIVTKGVAPGILSGGKLQIKLRKLRVKGFYTKLPNQIEINISNLEIGSSVKVGELKGDGVEFLDNPNAVVASVKVTRVAVVTQEEETAAATATTATPAAAPAATEATAPAKGKK